MKYVAGVAIMLALSAVVEFPWFAAGLSALLAWLTNLPGTYRVRILGVLSFIGLGVALAVLAHLLQGPYWPWLVAMFLVAFGGTFGLIVNKKDYMLWMSSKHWSNANPPALFLISL